MHYPMAVPPPRPPRTGPKGFFEQWGDNLALGLFLLLVVIAALMCVAAAVVVVGLAGYGLCCVGVPAYVAYPLVFAVAGGLVLLACPIWPWYGD